MRILKFFLLIFMVKFLTGCASTYVAPTSGPQAKLGVYGQQFWTNQNQIFIFKDPILCKEPYLLTNLSKRVKGEAVPIEGNQLVTVNNVNVRAGYLPVSTSVTFYANQNETYLIKTKEITGAQISFQILKEVNESAGKKYSTVPFVKRALKSGGFSGLDTVCTDLDIQKKLKDQKSFLKNNEMVSQDQMLHRLPRVIVIPVYY